MSFVYFTTNQDGRPDPAELGVGYAFDGPPAYVLDTPGPGGRKGTLFAAAADAIRFDPAAQQWAELPGGVSVGMTTAAPPTAADLARPQAVDGEWIELAAGGRWQVPRLRTYLSGNGFAVALPCRAVRSAGQWTQGPVLDEWRSADQAAERLMEVLFRGKPCTTAAALDLAAAVLGVNYRVGAEELGLLGALPMNDPRLVRLLRSAADWDTAEADRLGESARSAA